MGTGKAQPRSRRPRTGPASHTSIGTPTNVKAVTMSALEIIRRLYCLAGRGRNYLLFRDSLHRTSQSALTPDHLAIIHGDDAFEVLLRTTKGRAIAVTNDAYD
ncbi:hypothetical protein EVAR_47187_1 [Eumeta japonica]|uniref:Uncharacterized protein n=1 Tax=Eumeta variegata TaxID=151549 RepID=A0A4C1WX92_EUMVA|nr:hypothetical protein EVAR_47187_1 [Eumeta japonica]